MREDREDRVARGALDPPNGHPTETDTHIRGVACQAAAPATGGFVFQLKAEGQDESKDTFQERLAIAKQLEVGRFVAEIDRLPRI